MKVEINKTNAVKEYNNGDSQVKNALITLRCYELLMRTSITQSANKNNHNCKNLKPCK